MPGVLSGTRTLMPRALAAAALATAAFATLGAEAQAAGGYRKLCSASIASTSATS